MAKQRWTIIQPEWRYRVVSTMIPPAVLAGLRNGIFATYRSSPSASRCWVGTGPIHVSLSSYFFGLSSESESSLRMLIQENGRKKAKKSDRKQQRDKTGREGVGAGRRQVMSLVLVTMLSKHSPKGLAKPLKTHVTIVDPLDRILDVPNVGIRETSLLCKQHVCFDWVRGHVGNTGNERADHLAKMAAISETEHTYSKQPLSYVKMQMKVDMLMTGMQCG
ncbi:hypothetical protein ANN_01614 [Periplaneta americana]|uniref:RNase H type-1 domain-containing protein n=1 Tax=Periplaneta americana TaxID=6978 RepID=A0ABQ8TU23_PERAM|nr:hypothetical protein ANN_01614 [Periplaneta americana]